MATYKPMRKTANGMEEIKIPYAVLADPPTIPDISGFMPKSGGTFTGNISVPKTITFTDETNPFIKMRTGSTDFYFQSTSGQFGLGPTWEKATHWDANGNVTFPTTPKVGSTSLALTSQIQNGTLTIQKNGTTVKTFSANQSGNVTANITVPTKVSELENDSGFTSNAGTVISVQANGTTFNPDSTGKVNLGNIGGGSGPLQFSDTVVMTEAEFSEAYLAGTLQNDKLYLIEGETGTVNFVSTADHIVYNNANSGLTATNLQGAVDEINNKIFSGSYNDLTDKPTLFSGSYNDLTDKPTLFSGSYDDLTNKPTLFSGSYNDLTDKPTLFSGSYNDLTDKPAALTQTDILTLLNLTEEQLTKLIALLNKLTVDTTSVKFNNTTVKATTFDVQ